MATRHQEKVPRSAQHVALGAPAPHDQSDLQPSRSVDHLGGAHGGFLLPAQGLRVPGDTGEIVGEYPDVERLRRRRLPGERQAGQQPTPRRGDRDLPERIQDGPTQPGYGPEPVQERASHTLCGHCPGRVPEPEARTLLRG